MPLAQRFSINTPVAVGPTAGANLSQKDIFPIQPVSKGTGVDDEKLTLQQIQAIPYGAASLSGTTYNVTFSNYPTDFNPVIGQTIIIKFNNAKAGTDALNLSINGQLIPMLMQGEAITEIAANQIIEFTMIGNIVNGTQTITHANASAGVTAAKVNNQINGALANLDKIKFATVRSGTNLDIILNDYKGKVYFQLCDNNSSGTKPSGVTSGIVQTLAWDSENYATQIYTEIDTNHRMFIRYNNNGNWTSWQKLVTESDLYKEKGKYLNGTSNVINEIDISSYEKNRTYQISVCGLYATVTKYVGYLILGNSEPSLNSVLNLNCSVTLSGSKLQIKNTYTSVNPMYLTITCV